MIEKNFTTTFSNSRMVWYEESAEMDDSLGFNGHIQQVSAEVAQSLGISFTKAFQIWCPIGTDVVEGDELVGGGYTYNVKAVKTLNLGRNPHKQVFVERQENYG